MLSGLAPLNPKLSLPSELQKAILEVSVWGEICQLFSTTLHQHQKKKKHYRLRASGNGTQAADMDLLFLTDLGEDSKLAMLELLTV